MASIKAKTGYPQFKYAGIASTYTDGYLLEGYTEAAALVALAAATDLSKVINGVVLSNVEYDLRRRGKPSANAWTGMVNWKHTSASPQYDIPQNTSDEKLSFSFSGPSTFFTQAISQEKFGAESIDVGFAINVNKKGDVEGMDVGIPSSGFQVRTKQNLGADAVAINVKIKDLIGLLHTKNAAEFRSLEPGDCLLTSFSGEERNDSDFDMTYDFATELTVDYTGSPLDAGLVTFDINRKVKGFDLKWIMYEEYENGSSMVPLPIGLYVAEVFENGDFSTIGITV